jgi:uncharacterized membrane protein
VPHSVTKYIQIERPAAGAYAFLAEPATMPRWAIHNVKSVKPLENGRWELHNVTQREKHRTCT